MTPKGIVQVDAELAEDGTTVVLYGYTKSPDRTYVALVDLPEPISPDSFDPAEWKKAATQALWVLHA